MALSIEEVRRNAAARKRKQRAHPDGYGKSRRVDWTRLGIDRSFTHQDYLELIIAQHSMCAICGSPIDNTSPLDHSHETGKVRGVLCHSCNLLLGHMEKGNAVLLHSAARYLERAA